MPLGLPPPNPGFELFAASRGYSQGLAQTQGPQVRPRAYLQIGPVQLGAQWRNIDNPAFAGIRMLYARIARDRGDTHLEGTILYRRKTGAKAPVDRQAWELDAVARRSFGKLAVRMTAEYAPSEFELGPSLYLEGGPSLVIANGTSVSANIGRRERSGAPDYTTFNAGMTRSIGGKLSLDARLYATNHPERGTRYRASFVVSARLTLSK